LRRWTSKRGGYWAPETMVRVKYFTHFSFHLANRYSYARAALHVVGLGTPTAGQYEPPWLVPSPSDPAIISDRLPTRAVRLFGVVVLWSESWAWVVCVNDKHETFGRVMLQHARCYGTNAGRGRA
jgi:hypothetical protein